MKTGVTRGADKLSKLGCNLSTSVQRLTIPIIFTLLASRDDENINFWIFSYFDGALQAMLNKNKYKVGHGSGGFLIIV